MKSSMKTTSYSWFKPTDPRIPVVFSKRHPPKRGNWFAEVWKHRSGKMVEFVRGKKNWSDPHDMDESECGWCPWCAGAVQRRSSTKFGGDNKTGVYWMTTTPDYHCPNFVCKDEACAKDWKKYMEWICKKAEASLKLSQWRHPSSPKK